MGDALSMLLVLPSAYFEGSRPALNGTIISHGQINIGALEIVEERGAVNCEGGLPGQGRKKFEPILGRSQNRAMIDFQNSFHLAFVNQWNRIVTGKFLPH